MKNLSSLCLFPVALCLMALVQPMHLLAACSPANCDWCQLYYTNTTTDRFLGVLSGNGDGTFQAPRYLLNPGTKACFYDVKAEDINQDGHVDALALDFSVWRGATNELVRQKRILIFTNNGTGSFTTDHPQRVIQTAGEGPRAFTLAYLDETLAGGTAPPPGATLDLGEGMFQWTDILAAAPHRFHRVVRQTNHAFVFEIRTPNWYEAVN